MSVEVFFKNILANFQISTNISEIVGTKLKSASMLSTVSVL
jgi:hypothetical protein